MTENKNLDLTERENCDTMASQTKGRSMNKTDRLQVRVSNKIKKEALAKAEEIDLPLSHIIRQLLKKWLAEK